MKVWKKLFFFTALFLTFLAFIKIASPIIQESFLLDLENATFIFTQELFNDSSSFKLLSFGAEENKTVYVRIPKNSTILSSKIRMKGVMQPVYSVAGQQYGNIYDVYVADVNFSLPFDEIVVGTNNPANVTLLNRTGGLIWSYGMSGYVYSVAVGDLLEEEGLEIVAGDISKICLLNSSGHEKECKNFGSEVYDLEILQSNQIVAAVGSKLFLLDSSLNEIWNRSFSQSCKGVGVGNLTNGEELEIVVACGSTVYCFDSSGNQFCEKDFGSSITDVDVGNLNEGFDEIAASLSNGSVIVLNNQSEILWSYSIGSSLIDNIKIGEVTTEYDGNEIVFGSENNNVYVLSSSGSLVWSFKTEAYVGGVAIGNLSTTEGNEVVAGTFASTHNLYILNFEYYPTNPWLDIGNDSFIDWSYSGKFRGETEVSNNTAIQEYLSSCFPDEKGNCDIPLIFHSDFPGNLNVSIEISFLYNISNLIYPQTIQEFSRVDNIRVNESVGSEVINITFIKNPSVNVQVKYIKVSQEATQCDFNGKRYAVGEIEGKKVCNISSSPLSIPSTGSLPLAKLWYTGMQTSTPILMNESEGIIEGGFWKKNLTIWNETETIFTNVIANSSIDESQLIEEAQTFLFVDWFNNGTLYDITPSSTSNCNSPNPTFTQIKIGNDTFQVCKQDLNGNGIAEFFLWKQPHTNKTFTHYELWGSANYLPNLTLDFNPTYGKWGETFNLTVNATDHEMNNITLIFCLNLTKTFNLTSLNLTSLTFNCSEEINISSGENVTWVLNSEKNWTGYNVIKIKYRDFDNITGFPYHTFVEKIYYWPNVTKHSVSVDLVEGNNSSVNRNESVLFGVKINDIDLNEEVEGANCSFWVELNETTWDWGYKTVSNSTGNCEYLFKPNGSYYPGERKWRAGVFNDFYYEDTNSTDFTVKIYGKLNINITRESLQNATRGKDKILVAKIFDEFGKNVEISGYNCIWYVNNVETNQTLTNSSGYCSFTWKTNCSFDVGIYLVNVSLSGNVNPYFLINKIFDANQIALKDILKPEIISPLNNSIFVVPDTVELNSSVLDGCNEEPTHNFNVTWNASIRTEIASWWPVQECFNLTENLNATWELTSKCAPSMVNLTAKAHGDFYIEREASVIVWIYGEAEVNLTSPKNESTINRTEAGKVLNLICFVQDPDYNVTPSLPLQGYPINFSYIFNQEEKFLGTNYTNASSYATYYWNISDEEKVPEGEHVVKCEIGNFSLGPHTHFYAKKKEDSATIYIINIDTAPPNITGFKATSAKPGENVTIEANVTDWYGVDKVWINLTYPNSTWHLIYLQNATPDKRRATWRVNLSNLEEGDYDLILYANDSSANGTLDPSHTSFIKGWFNVYPKVNFTASLTTFTPGYSAKIKLEFYRNGSNWLVHDLEFNSSQQILEEEIFSRKYDVKAYVDTFSPTSHSKNNLIKFFNSSINQNSNFFFQADYIDPTWIYTVELGIFGIKGFAFKTNLSFSHFDLTVNYSAEYERCNPPYCSETQLKIWKCDDWNYSSKKCNSQWVKYDALIDFNTHTIKATFTNLSAFLVGVEAQIPTGGGATGGGGGGGGGIAFAPAIPICGNGICETGENPYNCPEDCGYPFSTKTNLTEVYLLPNEKKRYAITIFNNLNKEIEVSVFLTGNIQGIANIARNKVLIANLSNVTIPIDVNSPSTTGTYTGSILVSGAGYTQELPVTINVLEKQYLPSLKLSLEILTKKAQAGKDVNFKVIYDTGPKKTIEAKFLYSVIEERTKKEILVLNTSKILEGTSIFMDNITLPQNISTGAYFLKITAFYDDESVSAVDSFEVIIPLLTPARITQLSILLILICSVTAIIYGRKKYLSYKAKKARYIFPVDVKSLPKGDLWLGKIAETEMKMSFDKNDLTTHVLIAGATGSGKTVTGTIFVEELLEKKIPVVVFDPTAQWTGFMRPCTDPKVLKYYKKHGLTPKDARFYPGNILEITDPNVKIDLRKYMKPGEITVFVLSKLKPGDYDIAITNIVDTIFRQGWEESTELKLVVVFDEVHRLLERYGGTGGYIALERACREFRKWGIGLIMISQVLSDFKEAIKGNVLTEIQMHTKSLADLQRIERKYGLEYAKRVAREEVGIGMMQNPKYNKGMPWFISFRPPLHMPHKLPSEELEKYKQYNLIIEKIELEIEKLKKKGVDVSDLEIDLKLATDKLKHGMFRMAEIYIEALTKRLGIRA